MEVWSSSTPDFIHKVESVDDNSPYYRWTSELDLSAYNDPQYGTATGVSVDKTSDAGYVYKKGVRALSEKSYIKRWLCEGEYVDDTKRLL